MIKTFITGCYFLLLSSKVSTGPPQSTSITIERDLFEEAVALIKEYEGWHSSHFPYIGYGHRLTSGETFNPEISKLTADSLLRNDLRKKCAVFRNFGKDSLLLGVLSYNVGEYNLLGYGRRPKSVLIRKLETGDRNIEKEYMSFRRANGKVLPSLERRRKAEFNLLFNKIKKNIQLKLENND